MKQQDNVTTSKLGKTRAGERSRIWLEGKRLTAHGFTRGTEFAIYERENQPGRWFLRPFTLAEQLRLAGKYELVKSGTVAGTDARPIIDTVGALVFDTFGTVGNHVRCEFHQGQIIIEAIKGSK